MAKLIHLDTETTGFNPVKNGIHQLAGHIEINGEKKDSFSYFIRPFRNDVVEPKALAVSNSDERQIAQYDAPDVVYKRFISLLSQYISKFDQGDKFYVVGYNVKFDTDFLRAFFEKNDDKYYGAWFYGASIDVMSLFAFYLAMKKDEEVINHKLEAAANYFNIDKSGRKMHNAVDDSYLTTEIYKELISRLGLIDGLSERYN